MESEGVLSAVDTNVILRRLTRDDELQAEIADRLFNNDDIFISATVLIETEWVLRSYYKWERNRINEVLCALISLPNIVTANEELLRWALSRHGEGGDFADMIHVAGAQSADRFVTFDHRVNRFAGNEAGVLIETIGAA